jgi:hypothetical protein
MDISYSADPTDIDRPAFEAQAERPDRPIRLRIQPTLLRVKPGGNLGNHRSWSGVSWTLECPTAEEVVTVRLALQAFFAALAKHGAVAVEKALTASVVKK